MTDLSTWTVIVARDDAPDDDMSRALLAERVAVVPLRLMRTERLDAPPFQGDAAHFDVVAYASKTAVDASGGDHFGVVLANDGRVAAVGRATAARLQEHGVIAHVVGDGGGAALAALLAPTIKGKRVLLPRAVAGNDDLRQGLVDAGADVVVVDAYRSVAVEVDAAAVEEAGDGAGHRALLLTSPLRVKALLDQVRLPDDVVVIAMGGTTGDALREAGRRVDVVLREPTPEALLEALTARQTGR